MTASTSGIPPESAVKAAGAQAPAAPRCLAILGPTCAWKTDVALIVARQLRGEIISCDSMQVYRGLDIGTAKPSVAMRDEVAHHLVDILDIHEPYDANQFVARATPLLASLTARGALPILVGGTGLYAKALIYDVPFQPADRGVFADVCQQAQTPEGRRMLVDELAKADATVAARLAPNPRRVMRAVEILRITGNVPAAAVAAHPDNAAESAPRGTGAPFCQAIIMPAAAMHRARIGQRVDAMLAAGWIKEARALIENGLLQTPTARQVLGYRDIGQYLDGTLSGFDQLRERLIARTAQYARRQRTWFRHQHPGAWIIDADTTAITAESLAERILREAARHGFLAR